MNTIDKEPQSEIEALLPWHAAGTLSRSDARRVEEALASDPELARAHLVRGRAELSDLRVPAFVEACLTLEMPH